jgi:DNA-binding NtrC family response regulator
MKVETRTVLFVDDDKIVLRSLERGLIDEPYNKLFANGPKETLEILQQEKVHVIVTDMCMPVMDGLELLQIVNKKYPHIVKIVLSGYANQDTVQQAINQGDIFKFIAKPWKLEGNFKEIVLEAIDCYNLQSEHATVGQQS